jgi:PAT family beta-lactamase induction signal transducer AmpG
MSHAFFYEFGASKPAIGMTSLFAIPWVVKFLWAPLVDAFSTKRNWLLFFQLAVAVSVLGLGVASATPAPLLVGGFFFLITSAFSATHDIAIDGYYLEALDRNQQARYVGFQQAAYRLALITAGGGILAICTKVSWLLGYGLASAILIGLALLHRRFLPQIEQPKRSAAALAAYLTRPGPIAAVVLGIGGVAGLWAAVRSDLVQQALGPLSKISGPMWVVMLLALAMIVVAIRAPALKRKLYASESHYALAFVDYLDRPRIGVVLAFILTFRIGESMLQAMAYPFLRDIGITGAQYGLAHNTLGVIATIVGGIAAGFLIARFGLKRCIWPFVLALNSLNLLYMAMAWHYRHILENPDSGTASFWLVCLLVSAEALGAGFGQSAFAVFIMRTTKSQYKAAHFAIGTGLMNVASILTGVVSGFLAQALGFVVFFGVTAIATIPNMLLIPFLPFLDQPTDTPGQD